MNLGRERAGALLRGLARAALALARDCDGGRLRDRRQR